MTDHSCDLLVAGSGAGAFSAAITARIAGLDVVMTEKEAVFGGSTAYSAGVIWIPANSHAKRAGIADTKEAAFSYLQAIAGNRLDLERARAFVDNAANVLDFFEAQTHVRYKLSPTWADYEPKLAGGSDGGRSLGPAEFDGRRLGRQFESLRPPLSTMMVFGGMMIGREDLPHVFRIADNPKKERASVRHMGKVVGRHVRDRLTHKRGTRLVNGNALVAMLALSAKERGIPLWLSSPVKRLVMRSGRVIGAIVQRGDREVKVETRRGVVLACGGFPGDASLRQQLFGHVANGREHRSVPPASNTGDGIRLAEAVGGHFNTDVHHPAAWTPVSLVPQKDGTTVPFPHFIDRGKPGVISVDRRGKRFVSEARSYHAFMPALMEACKNDARIECWNIADSRAIRRFGLGAAPPWPGRITPFVRNGYLIEAQTLEALAEKTGIDRAGLVQTIAAFNAGAEKGVDAAFDRGSDAYQRFNGWAGQAPNPSLAPLLAAPFYAVRCIPGDIGTFAGLQTDARARVVNRDGAPIPGLWAAGNDAASVMGGTYPGGGITLGPALTFGWIAARDAVGS
jgi:succinate dehydrogenase/fumarate reductase flavoprotein subunit